MRNETALILIEIHKTITGNRKIDLTSKSFLQKYQIEGTILENMHGAAISSAPRPCSGCHNESGVAITVSTPSGPRYDFIYTSPSGKIDDPYSLTILFYDSKTSFICTEIYHRTPEQEPNSGWSTQAEGYATLTDQFLSTFNSLAS